MYFFTGDGVLEKAGAGLLKNWNMKTEIKWNPFPAVAPGATNAEYLVATTDPSIAQPGRPEVVLAPYVGGRFHYNGFRLHAVYAWANLPPAPQMGSGHEPSYL